MNQLTAFLNLFATGLLMLALPIVVAFVFQWLRQQGAELRGPARLGST
jgi:hypothetical protein